MSDLLQQALKHYEAQRYDAAAKTCEKYLQANAESLAGWNLLGAIAMGRGDARLAGEAFSRAVKIDPENAEVHNNLAAVLSHLGRQEEARQWAEAAVRLDSRSADAHFNLAIISDKCRDVETAVDHFARAAELAPDHARAHYQLGIGRARLGDFAAAQRAYRRALECAPGKPAPLYDMAQIAGGDETGPLLEEIEKTLAAVAMADHDRMLLHFAAGRLLDKQAAYDDAFGHFVKANALFPGHYDENAIVTYVDALIQTFTPDFFARRSDWGIDDATPVFIVGMPRSGTSLVEQILAGHDAVFGAGELTDLQAISWQLANHAGEGAAYPNCLSRIDRSVIEGYAKAYIKTIRGLSNGHEKRITDKMPMNIMQAGLIHLMFPNARIIHVTRSPMDTCLSCYFQYFSQGNSFSYGLQSTGHYYSHYHRIADHWKAVLPDRIWEISYESLVDDAAGEARRLIDCLGLDWQQGVLDLCRTRRPVATASVGQVRRPVYSDSVDRWRRYERHLAPLRAALGDLASGA